MSAGVLSAGFSFATKIENWLLYGLFAFFSTFAVYNGQRLLKADLKQQTPWLVWVKRNKKTLLALVIFSSVATVVVLGAILKSEWSALLFLGIAGFISVFYMVKIHGKNMRDIPHLKIHLIALSWAVVLIVFPVLNEGKSLPLFWIGLAHYFYVLGITIPFDIRDLKHDLPSQKTIPQRLGINASRILSVMLLLAFALIMMVLYHSLWFNWLFHLAVLTQMALVIFSNEKRGDVYFAGFIDGAIMFLGLSYFV